MINNWHCDGREAPTRNVLAPGVLFRVDVQRDA